MVNEPKRINDEGLKDLLLDEDFKFQANTVYIVSGSQNLTELPEDTYININVPNVTLIGDEKAVITKSVKNYGILVGEIVLLFVCNRSMGPLTIRFLGFFNDFLRKLIASLLLLFVN